MCFVWQQQQMLCGRAVRGSAQGNSTAWYCYDVSVPNPGLLVPGQTLTEPSSARAVVCCLVAFSWQVLSAYVVSARKGSPMYQYVTYILDYCSRPVTCSHCLQSQLWYVVLKWKVTCWYATCMCGWSKWMPCSFCFCCLHSSPQYVLAVLSSLDSLYTQCQSTRQ